MKIQKTNYLKTLISLFIFCVIIPAQSYSQLESTKGIGLAINHPADGATPFGSINTGIFPAPAAGSISINLVSGFGADPSTWLAVTSAGSTISLVIQNAATVPNPGGATASGCTVTGNTTCSGDVTDFGASTSSGCYEIEIDAGIAGSETYFICIFGDEPLAINPSTYNGFTGKEVGSSSDHSFSLNRAAGNFSWQVVGNPTYLTVTPDANTLSATLNFDPEAAIATRNHTLRVTNTADGTEVADATITVEAIDPTGGDDPVDVVFVIDISGSMGNPATCDGNELNFSKLDYLKDNFMEIYEQIDELFGNNSRVGVVTFASDSKVESLLKSPEDLEADFRDWTGNGGDAFTADGSTAMGKGIRDALSVLGAPDPDRQQYIILLTNGMQNVNPYLAADQSTGAIFIDNDPPDQDRMGPEDDEIRAGIQIIPMALFQPSDTYLDLLKQVASQTAGLDVLPEVCDLNQSLKDAINEVLRSSSPKTILFEKGRFSGTNATETFTISENYDKLLVSASVIGNHNLTFEIDQKKGGSWISISAGGNFRPAGNSNHRLFSINLPNNVGGNLISPNGEFRVRLSCNTSNLDYQMAVILDDRGVKHANFVRDRTHRAGDQLHLSTRLRYMGNPVTGNNQKVEAIIYRPGDSFGSLFSKKDPPKKFISKRKLGKENNDLSSALSGPTKLVNTYSLSPPTGQTFEPGLSIGDQKYQLLVYETDFLKQLKWKKEVIPLNHVGNGIYKGVYSKTNLTGVYQVQYIIDGQVPDVGEFKRLELKSIPFLFGKPKLEDSKLFVLSESPMYLSFKPVDVHGNLLGPGKRESIEVSSSIGSTGAAIDQLDGTYVYSLFVPGKVDPIITIKILGDILYQGPLSKIKRKKGWLALQGGLTKPLNNFDNDFDPAYFGELALGYQFTRKFGLRIEGGYYSFKDTLSANYSIIGGGAGLQLLQPFGSGAWDIHLKVMGGYYKPENIDGEFGVNGGIGLSRYFEHWFSIVLEGSYYRVFTNPDPIDFASASLGLRFHF